MPRNAWERSEALAWRPAQGRWMDGAKLYLFVEMQKHKCKQTNGRRQELVGRRRDWSGRGGRRTLISRGALQAMLGARKCGRRMATAQDNMDGVCVDRSFVWLGNWHCDANVQL